MNVTTLIFDLDQTLIDDSQATADALVATASLAHGNGTVASNKYVVNIEALADAVRQHAERLWSTSPAYDYAQDIGISAFEALSCRFEDDDATIDFLRQWAPEYRHNVWSRSLNDFDIHDSELAHVMSERFFSERRKRQVTFEDARPALEILQQRFTFGLLTNGASSLQRQKFVDSGLAEYFPVVIVSSEVGVGKPKQGVFEYALAQVRSAAHETIMIGDNLMRDVGGAIAAGMGAIWINRRDQPSSKIPIGCHEVKTLTELPKLLLDHELPVQDVSMS